MRGEVTMQTNEATMRRVNTRIPGDTYDFLERAAERRGLILTEGRGKGDAAIGQIIATLAREEEERHAKEPTLLALAKSDAPRARELILSAFTLSNGDGRAARAALGPAIGRTGEVSDNDWKAARDRLGLGEEIAKRWPARRKGA